MGTHPKKITRVCSSSPDLATNLPENAIENILLRLPLRDAAKTSLLSKTWRHRWRYLPHLVFDDTFFRSSSTTDTKPNSDRIFLNIFQILLLHRGPITKFSLSNCFLRNSYPEIDQMMLFLCDKPIQEFTLHHFNLHSGVFSFEQLQHLSLYGCHFDPPPTFGGFSRLLSLKFEDVSSDCDLHKSFISKCPLLEHLTMKWCSLDTLVLDIPNLKFLKFEGNQIEFVRLKNAPLLETVVIIATHDCGGVASCLRTLSKRVPTLKNLTMTCLPDGWFNETKSRTRLIHLRILKMVDVCFTIPEKVSWALHWIMSSPNLQNLMIKSDSGEEVEEDRDPCALEVLKSLEFSDSSLNNLQEVLIWNFSGCVEELEFVKFLLAKSVVLEELVIEPSCDICTEGGFNILKVVCEFPRASAKARIVYFA